MKITYKETITVTDAEDCRGCVHLYDSTFLSTCEKWKRILKREKAVVPCGPCLEARKEARE